MLKNENWGVSVFHCCSIKKQTKNIKHFLKIRKTLAWGSKQQTKKTLSAPLSAQGEHWQMEAAGRHSQPLISTKVIYQPVCAQA